jgi:hypothetical protein
VNRDDSFQIAKKIADLSLAEDMQEDLKRRGRDQLAKYPISKERLEMITSFLSKIAQMGRRKG